MRKKAKDEKIFHAWMEKNNYSLHDRIPRRMSANARKMYRL